MNRTIQHLSHLLATALVLLAMANCTADALPGTTDTAATDAGIPLRFAIPPRAAYADDRADTRVAQSADYALWEEGDVIWLGSTSRISRDIVRRSSALIYHGGAWLPFTEEETARYATADIPGFERVLKWHPQTTDYTLTAYYAGSGIPLRGVITINDARTPALTTDVMTTAPTPVANADVPVVLTFLHRCFRVQGGTADKVLSGVGCHTTLDVARLATQDSDSALSTIEGCTLTLPGSASPGYYFVIAEGSIAPDNL
ncbi:hypothetical protein [Bacteroides sp.]|uniref:hypothetical protein n=1 Tax=Bacteroides sp. TaxID=29523 RepID=UPI003AB83E95